MSHPLIPDLIEMLQAAVEFDFSKADAIKFIASLRDKLVFAGFSQEQAETIVSSMEIDIPPDSLDEEHIEQLSVLYCQILDKAHQSLVDNGFRDPMPALLKMAEKFTLTLS